MQKIFYTLLFLVSFSLQAQDDIYQYKFNLDTTIAGALQVEGHIFPNSKINYISIFNKFKKESIKSYIEFYDEKFSKLEKISFATNKNIKKKPLLFDFDNDSYDEVIFTIEEPEKLSFIYYDPSNSPVIKTKIFELKLHKDKTYYIDISLSSAQLDNDKFHELLLAIGTYPANTIVLNGIWAIDIEKKKALWNVLSTERATRNKMINILNGDDSYIIYSIDASTFNNKRFTFSNGTYFLDNSDGTQTIYNSELQKISSATIDTLSEDYSVDSVAYIRAIDNNNNLLWERKLGGIATKTHLDTITINNQKKIILIVFASKINTNIINSIEILNPLTGEIEKKRNFKQSISDYFVYKQLIYLAFREEKTIALDLELNQVASSKSNYTINMFGKYNNLLLLSKGSSHSKCLIAMNNEMEKRAMLTTKGTYSYLAKSKLISVHDTGRRKTKIYSIVKVPWYNRISMQTLRNLSISVLFILLLITLLWVNTLRLSSKKIREQKKKIEETHNKLKKTTSQLIRAEKLAVYGTVASGIAHEINSPLGAIINSAQRIKNDPNADIEKNISLIEKAGKKSKAIVEKLLISSRKKDNNEHTNLIDVLNDWKDLSQKQFDNLGINLISDIKCDKNLAISSVELNQIITNILFNARDAIMNSNSTIKEISISSKYSNNRCYLLIKDSGPGFSKAKLANPFIAFETTKEKGKGSGLGLWVVKNILDNVNGKINLRNYENGAEIEIIIPIFEEQKG
jgi:signal transduction histidine kinase